MENLEKKDFNFLERFFGKYNVPAGEGIQSLISQAISEYKTLTEINKDFINKKEYNKKLIKKIDKLFNLRFIDMHPTELKRQIKNLLR